MLSVDEENRSFKNFANLHVLSYKNILNKMVLKLIQLEKV